MGTKEKSKLVPIEGSDKKKKVILKQNAVNRLSDFDKAKVFVIGYEIEQAIKQKEYLLDDNTFGQYYREHPVFIQQGKRTFEYVDASKMKSLRLKVRQSRSFMRIDLEESEKKVKEYSTIT